MAIDLIFKVLETLSGSQLLKDKLQRNEHVIRVLKQVGLDPEHPPADFEGVYNYALVDYGVGKPRPCLELFRAGEIRRSFREAFDRNDGQAWMRAGNAFVEGSAIGDAVKGLGLEPRQELGLFAECFLGVVRRSRLPGDVLLSHQVAAVKVAVQQVAGMVQQQAIAAGQVAGAIEPGANCRALALAEQMRAWFEILGYRFESYAVWEADWFEWVIAVPVRRGRYDRVLVRGMDGEVGIKDVRSLSESMAAQKTDEGWVVTMRRVSQAARAEVEGAEGLAAFTLDELLDQEASFDLYLDWLEGEIGRRGIEARYVPIACTKEEVDPLTHQRLGVSRYGEADGWTEGYIDRWLDDPVKEHLSVLGEFGTGKTWLTLHYAAGALRRYREAQLKGMARPRLPIVIPLRDYAKAVSVESLFSEFFFRQHKLPIPHYDAFIQLNRMGKLLLIFDGFDEMAARVDKQQMINNFWELAKVVVPGSKVVLTCRTEHFPEAREGRSLLNAELQASTRGLSGETPQFEVLELEKFEDEQIRQVLGFSASEETVGLVMGNAQLLDLARRPVMTELILEALPDIEAGKPVDMSRVYLYAVRRKMERDIKAERTFTSMADKLYFLCELSWEMLSNDRMSLNYREFPDRIRKLFGAAVQEEKDLDHWHFDMMGQTMLIRNAEGDYTPAHRSLLEFFVAFKFAAELGALAPDFLEVAQMKSGIDRSLEPREYSWSEYFGGGAVAPLLGFRTEGLEGLKLGIGKLVLSKALTDLMTPILDTSYLVGVLKKLQYKSTNQVGLIGGNLTSLIIKLEPAALEGENFSNTSIVNADMALASLRDVDFSHCDLEGCNFIETFGAILSTSFSRDSKFLAIAGEDLIRILDTENWKEVITLKGHNSTVWSVSFSTEDGILASSSHQPTIKIWNIKTGECLKTLTGHTSWIRSVSFDRNGHTIASGGGDHVIRLWDVETGECKQILEGHGKWILSLAFSNDNLLLASGSGDNTIKIWNISTGKCLQTLIGHDNLVESVAFSPDDQLLATGSGDETIKVWDIQTGKCLRTIRGHQGWVEIVAFSPDGRFLASGASDFALKLWNVETGECHSTLMGHNSSVRSLAFNLDGRRIVSGGRDRNLNVWDVNTGECLRSIQGYNGSIRSLAFSPNNAILATAGDNQIINLWNVQNNKRVRVLRGHSDWIRSISISPSGRILASGGNDQILRLWDLETGICSHLLQGHTNWIRCVAFSPDSQVIASSGGDASIRLWDVKTGQCLKNIKGKSDVIMSLVFNSDGKYFASGGYDGCIYLWETKTGKCVNVLNAHDDWIRFLSFSFDDQLLASCSDDKTIKLWDIFTGQMVWMETFSESVFAIAISHNGQLLATAHADKTIRIWNIELQSCQHVLKRHTNSVFSVAFSADDNLLASSGMTDSIYLWNVSTGKLHTTLIDRPYEGMNITGAKGLNESTIASLKALGAIEDEEMGGEKL